MNYDLAKILKENGFPQDVPYWRSDPSYSFIDDEEDETWYNPTLAELVEACGDKFNFLSRKNGGWMASSEYEVREGLAYHEEWFGKTPEEAIANLWLALNKKS